MRLEKLSENKFKVLFTTKELEENDISLHSFLSNKLESQKFFLALLEIAHEDFGFDIDKSNISYEMYSFDYKSFVIFVTISNTHNSSDYIQLIKKINVFSNSNPRDSLNRELFSFNFNGNRLTHSLNFPNNLLLFFYNIEDILDFCDYIEKNYIKISFSAFLYQYNNLYFIDLEIEALSEEEKKFLYNILSETTLHYINNENLVRKFKEYSKLVSNSNLF